MMSGVAGVEGGSILPSVALVATTSCKAAAVSAETAEAVAAPLGSLTIFGPFSKTRPAPELTRKRKDERRGRRDEQAWREASG